MAIAMADMEKEERAYALLQWGAIAPLAPFNEALAADGFYSRVQKERSDKALDAFDKEQEKSRPTTELDAFRQLCAWGVFTNSDFYSPEKADNSVYSHELKFQQHQRQLNAMGKGLRSPSATRQQGDSNVSRGGMAPGDAQSGGRTGPGPGRQGRRINRGNRASQEST
jgi:hypothetical protein